MPWPLRVVADVGVYLDALGAGQDTIGMCWKNQVPGVKTSPDYNKNRIGQPLMFVVHPPGGPEGLMCLDQVYPEGRFEGTEYVVIKEHVWTVTGEWPNITVTPSINSVGRYHGWIQNGVITDDCEGRKF